MFNGVYTNIQQTLASLSQTWLICCWNVTNVTDISLLFYVTSFNVLFLCTLPLRAVMHFVMSVLMYTHFTSASLSLLSTVKKNLRSWILAAEAFKVAAVLPCCHLEPPVNAFVWHYQSRSTFLIKCVLKMSVMPKNYLTTKLKNHDSIQTLLMATRSSSVWALVCPVFHSINLS